MPAQNNKEKKSTDKPTLVTDELYNSLRKAIQTLLKDSIVYAEGITEKEIKNGGLEGSGLNIFFIIYHISSYLAPI